MVRQNLLVKFGKREFLVSKVKAEKTLIGRASQGDILRDIQCIEYARESNGIIEVSTIEFPLVVILTQDCDLEQDSRYRLKSPTSQPSNHDKKLFSVLVAPLYNAEHVFSGKHLELIEMDMTPINKKKSPGEILMKNERPRYHYIDFPEEISIVSSIVDFKHYFTISTSYLQDIWNNRFVCRLSELYREDLSQRFTSYLARIALPDEDVSGV